MSKYVITIGRQYGAGGRAIGKLLAEKLGISYYDKEILTEAAKHSGVDSKVLTKADERAPSFFNNLLAFNMGVNTSAYFLGNMPLPTDEIYRAQSDVMLELAKDGPCVLVGRTADYVLRNHECLISVFIHAPEQYCIERILQLKECKTEKEAQALAEQKNKARAEYYNFYTDKTWGEAESYDLSIDSSKLGDKLTADFLVSYVKARIEE